MYVIERMCVMYVRLIICICSSFYHVVLRNFVFLLSRDLNNHRVNYVFAKEMVTVPLLHEFQNFLFFSVVVNMLQNSIINLELAPDFVHKISFKRLQKKTEIHS